MHRCVIPSPLGPLAICEEDGAICAIDFTEDVLCPPGTPLLKEASYQLCAYFDGSLTEFDLPLRMEGTAFRLKCWEALRTIPYGETVSYREQAKRIGNPKAVRAVGGANHHNPISIVVPCHRVIGTDGTLTGYGGGMDKKKWLLEHERKHQKRDCSN
jgi:methylated-DNA-[protein]-cysteine S-methyltransferase